MNVFFSVDEGRGQSDQLDRINQIESIRSREGSIKRVETFQSDVLLHRTKGLTQRWAILENKRLKNKKPSPRRLCLLLPTPHSVAFPSSHHRHRCCCRTCAYKKVVVTESARGQYWKILSINLICTTGKKRKKKITLTNPLLRPTH